MSDIIPSPARRCSRCNADFLNLPAKSGYPYYCPLCYSQYRKERRDKGFGVLSPEQKRDANLRRNYGVTAKQYDQMFAQQNGVCAICKQPETRIEPRSKTGAIRHLTVDHDHETNRVRALLCGECNAALGFLNEDPQRAQALLRYIIEECK
jgi:Recombination endonuclease VII